MKKRICFAGHGELVERLIEATSRDFAIVAVILTERMGANNIARMSSFCHERSIPTQVGFEGAQADAFLTPNFPLLLPAEFAENHLCVNVHYALLPKYRGFHPVQCALINDEPIVGYSVHRVDGGVDSGPIFFQEQLGVTDADSVHTLNARMTNHLVANFPRYLKEIFDGKQPAPQDESDAIYCGKRHPEDGLIDWGESSRAIFNLVRAVCPPYYPGAYTFWKERKIIITAAEEQQTARYRHIAGQVVDVRMGRGLLVKTGDTLLWLKRVQIDEVEGSAETLIGRRIGLRFQSQPTP
jgi:methionyl-tRNA formyltransferase